MVTWNASIPQSTNLISNSQPLLLQNNQTINTVFNDSTNGDFTKVAMQNVGTVTAAITDPVGVFHILNGVNAMSGHPLPYFASSQGDFPLMADVKTSGTQKSFVLGTVIVNYGVVVSSLNTVNINFIQNYTSSSSYVCFAQPDNGGSLTEGQWTVQRNSASQMQTRRGSGSTGAVSIFYFAIGT